MRRLDGKLSTSTKAFTPSPAHGLSRNRLTPGTCRIFTKLKIRLTDNANVFKSGAHRTIHLSVRLLACLLIPVFIQQYNYVQTPFPLHSPYCLPLSLLLFTQISRKVSKILHSSTILFYKKYSMLNTIQFNFFKLHILTVFR